MFLNKEYAEVKAELFPVERRRAFPRWITTPRFGFIILLFTHQYQYRKLPSHCVIQVEPTRCYLSGTK